MFAKQFRLVVAVSAVAVSLLVPCLARAASPQDFEASWIGQYVANGNAVGSCLYLRSTASGFVGDWDGYKVIGSRLSGNVLTLNLDPHSAKFGASPGVHHYVVACTYNPDRTLSIVYDGVDANGNRVPGIHGYTTSGNGFVKP